jgi:hypothetical protein
MDIILRIVDTLRTSFKYTYLTNTEFAKFVDFPYTEEIDNDGKTYFLLEEKNITFLTKSQRTNTVRKATVLSSKNNRLH